MCDTFDSFSIPSSLSVASFVLLFLSLLLLFGLFHFGFISTGFLSPCSFLSLSFLGYVLFVLYILFLLATIQQKFSSSLVIFTCSKQNQKGAKKRNTNKKKKREEDVDEKERQEKEKEQKGKERKKQKETTSSGFIIFNRGSFCCNGNRDLVVSCWYLVFEHPIHPYRFDTTCLPVFSFINRLSIQGLSEYRAGVFRDCIEFDSYVKQ